ncbi:Response regulator receiver domain-containing protein [Palleronia marisminoris]|uniref:Two-component response regulator n=1 Tax=Palleronia marisminoris TaxID=315423 RepID=A0A1Y5TIU3_9RHOB|nr:response regulator [Palleronia marisminoris]SFH42605.1 Response regulator receiver domain-containing protein [Palleronia marisminoris]SLN65351.1 two-component response regulator [Palleronia marisminoris]
MEGHSIAGSKILLVEDEALFGVDLAMTLEERGFVVSGPLRHMATARAEIAAGRVDLALLDIDLGPGLTSFDIARVLQAHGVPYIFVSGHAPSAVELPADLSSFARMTKPVDVPNLLVLMRDALGSEATVGLGTAPTRNGSGQVATHRLV